MIKQHIFLKVQRPIAGLVLALGAATAVADAQTLPQQTITGRSIVFVVNDDTLVNPQPLIAMPLAVSQAPTPLPTATPGAPAIATLDVAAQNAAIVRGLQRRGFRRATTDFAAFAHGCNGDPMNSAPIQLHWSLGESNVLRTSPLLGWTWTSVSLQWNLYDCLGKSVGPGTVADKDMFYANSTVYRRYSARIPLNSIMAIVSLTNALHDNLIHSPLIAGFSSGVGAINTFLDYADSQTGLPERSFYAAADKLAADVCGVPLFDDGKGGKVAFNCLRVSRING